MSEPNHRAGDSGLDLMQDLLVAIGLVLVLEGVLYAAAPDAMKRMIVQMLAVPSDVLRVAGLVAMAAGVVLVWLVR